MNIKIKKLNDNAVVPKWNNKSAGCDLSSTEFYILKPGERKLFKTGLAMAIPEGLYGRIAPRSGLAYKHGIDVLAGVIDCFSDSSLVKTETGEKLATELKLGDVVYSVNNRLEIERDFIKAVVDVGEKDIIKIETDDGSIEITSGTLVYTETGPKKAIELKIGEKILHF